MFRQLWPYMLRYKRQLIFGFSCIVISNMIAVINPQIVQRAIDYLREQIVLSQLLLLSAAVIGVAAFNGVFRFMMRKEIINASRYIENDLRNDLFASLQMQSDAYFQQISTGDIMARLTNDLSSVRSVLGPGLMYTANTITSFIFVLIMMIRINPFLTLMAMIPVPIMVIVVNYFNNQINKRYTVVQAQYSTISTKVQENLAGMRIVKSYVLENSEIHDFNRLNLDYINKNMRYVKMQGAFRPTMMLIVGFGIALILLVGGRLIINGTISLGQFVAFNMYLGMLVWPSIALGWVMSIFNEGVASMKRLDYILFAPPDIKDDEQVKALAAISGQITFKDLKFKYPARQAAALEDINIYVPQGHIVAIVGRTGSGKSTLIKMLLRIYDPPNHTLFIDGEEIHRIPLKVLRASIGYIPQETFLFSDTIRSNIAFAAADADQQDIEWAARIAQIHDSIMEFPEDYETLLGERGINLSGGQKQRVAMARAILKKPQILILDDALSAVDTVTEEAILDNLRLVMKGRTCFWVSHRISSIKNADLIIVIDNGRIIERGKHDQLLTLGGIYADLFEKQQLEETLQRAE